MKQENNVSVFAFGAGTESKESSVGVRYAGVGSVFVDMLNPTAEELGKYQEREIDKEIIYVGKTKDKKTGEEFDQIRLDFIVRTDPEKNNGIDFNTKLSFFVAKRVRQSDSGKCQVIDKYGRTAWVTKEEFDKKAIPVYANGPAMLDPDYRPCFDGEEVLTSFLKAYLNIPSVQWKKDGEIHTIDNPADAESRLDNIEKIIDGDVDEIKAIVKSQPTNKIKVCFGIKTTSDNKQYQDAYTPMVLKNVISKYQRLADEIKDRQSNGAYPSTEFSFEPLHEVKITPTNVSAGEPSAPPAPKETKTNGWWK